MYFCLVRAEDVPERFRAVLAEWIGSQKRGAQARLSRATGISPVIINEILSGKRAGTEEQRRKIAAALGYEYDQFLASRSQTEDAGGAPRQIEIDNPQIWDLLEKTREVLLCGDPVMASALQSNILAFHQAVRNQSQAQEDRKRAELNAKALQARIEDLEQKVSAGPPRQNTGTEGEA